MKHNVTNIITYTLAALSLCVLGATVYFLENIKVLDEWTLTLPSQEIHVGDTVVVQSTYNKVREAAGESVRYIQCQNRDGIWIRYELNRATANRQAGRGGTGIVLTVRRDIADVPTRCKFTIALRYDVLPFKKVYLSQDTKEFTLLSEQTDANSSDVPAAAIQRSQSQVLPVNPVASSSYNSTPLEQSPQRDNSQQAAPTDSPAPMQPGSSVLDVITNSINNLTKGVLGG